MLLDREADARIHARLQTEAGVGNLDLDLRGARRRIEHRRHARDAAGEVLAGIGVDFDLGRGTGGDAPQILFDDVGDEPDGADVDDGDERRVHADAGAGIERPLADEPVDRRGDDGVGQVDLQLVEARLA